MKKFIVWAIALGLAFSHIQGVCAVGTGFKAGWNIPKIENDNSSGAELAFQVGGFLSVDLNDKFAVQPEFYWAPKIYSADESPYVKLKIFYLEFPVLLKYKVFKGLSFFAGPYAAFNFKFKNISSENEGPVITVPNLKGTDFGVIIGGEVKINILGTVGLILDLRYSQGLSRVYSEFDLKNSNFTVMAGFLLK